MSVWLSILRSLTALTGLTTATTRLIRAVQETERRPPPMPQDASRYLKGYSDGRFKLEEADRLDAAYERLMTTHKPPKPEEPTP